MSFSESLTAPMRRKQTASEHVTDNGDPLVIKKKVREAAKKNTQVFLFKNKIKSILTFHSNQALSTSTKIVFSLKPFLKKHPESLKVLMEVMTMRMTNP
jgi:hypothetical protein